MSKLSASQIKSAVAATPHWNREGHSIVRRFEFKHFPAAIQFVRQVAKLAEKAWHHPDIDIRWNKVVLTLTTHEEGGLTSEDFTLARQFNRLIAPSRR